MNNKDRIELAKWAVDYSLNSAADVAPSRGERRQLRELLPVVAAAERAAATAAGVAEVAHGFVVARSPVTGAVRHVGYAVTVSCDLSGWFDSVRADQLSGLPPAVLAQVLVDGAPRQGLPTSPACANLAAVPMDAEIVAALRLLPCRAVYTRYADDLVVSLSDTAEVGAVLRNLADAASAQGWVIHPGRTKVQLLERLTARAVNNTPAKMPRQTSTFIQAGLE